MGGGGGGGGGGSLKIVLGKKWQPVIGTGLAKSLTISHTCLLSQVFASFAFLIFSVFSFQEK